MTEPAPETDGEALSNLEVEADQAIEACGGDAKAAVIALLVANEYLEHELALTRAAVSSGFSRQWHHNRAKQQASENVMGSAEVGEGGVNGFRQRQAAR